MNKLFDIKFLQEALDFLDGLDEKSRTKIIYNIDKSRYTKDPKLLKKLNNEIWEFRTRFSKKQYRLLAFWDKRDNEETLIIATHGFIKTSKKINKNEIKKAEELMKEYLDGD